MTRKTQHTYSEIRLFTAAADVLFPNASFQFGPSSAVSLSMLLNRFFTPENAKK